MLKNRTWWLLAFYAVLTLFIIYELIFLILVSKNDSLKKLYIDSFTISIPQTNFNPSNYFCIFTLPIIGLVLSIFAFTSSAIISKVYIEKNPKFKLFFLILTFTIFIIGFLLSFTAQVCYSEWNNDKVMILSKGSLNDISASSFYYWLSFRLIWSLFGLFFAIIVVSVILIAKLNFINIQIYNFACNFEDKTMLEPELKEPLRSSSEFDPNETQTIIIKIDENEKK